MTLKSKPATALNRLAPKPETTPMSMPFKLHRALDVMAAILIVVLSLGTGAATALLQA